MHAFRVYNKKVVWRASKTTWKHFFCHSFWFVSYRGAWWILDFCLWGSALLQFNVLLHCKICYQRSHVLFFYKKYNHQIVQCNNIFVPRSTGAESSTVWGGWHALVIWLKVQNDVMPIRIVFPFQVLDLIRHTRKHLHYTYWLFIHIKQKNITRKVANTLYHTKQLYKK